MARHGSDIGLGQADLDEGESCPRSESGPLSRSMILQVVEVDTQHRSRPSGLDDGSESRHQRGLAVEAAVGVVDPVRRILHLVGVDGGPLETPLRSEEAALIGLSPGE